MMRHAAFIHLQNAIEVYYFAHPGGRARCVLNPAPGAARQDALRQSQLDRPRYVRSDDLRTLAAGNVEGADALARLENIGVQLVEAMDADLWRDAARLKSQFRRVSLADCFGVALVASLQCSLCHQRPARTRSPRSGGRGSISLYSMNPKRSEPASGDAAATPQAAGAAWLSVADAAALSGVSIRAMQKRAASGTIGARKIDIGAAVRWEIDARELPEVGRVPGRVPRTNRTRTKRTFGHL